MEAEQAVAAAERAADPVAVGTASNVLAVLRTSHGNRAGCLAVLERALAAIGQDLETADLRLLLLHNRLSTLSNLDRLAEAKAAVAWHPWPPKPSRRDGPTSGWAALSPAEARIARLVADGRSNPDIAAELLVSRRTIETHVSHILAKLGARSRVDIARQAGHPTSACSA